MEVDADSGHEKGLSLKLIDVHTGLDKQNFERKIINTFLLISFNMCYGCSKEQSH